jgi:hypothetical protein
LVPIGRLVFCELAAVNYCQQANALIEQGFEPTSEHQSWINAPASGNPSEAVLWIPAAMPTRYVLGRQSDVGCLLFALSVFVRQIHQLLRLVQASRGNHNFRGYLCMVRTHYADIFVEVVKHS